MSYFVIADITNPNSSPFELLEVLPDYQIPFVPIIQEGELPFAMMVDLQKKYNWVLPAVTYDSMETLIKVLKPLIIDPAMKKEFRGTDATVGFVSSWESTNKDVGKGEQEIKGIKDGERIDYEIRFIEPFASTSSAFMSTEAVSENQTKVKWNFHGVMPYPMNLMQLVMDMDKAIGGDLLTGLTNLKKLLEK